MPEEKKIIIDEDWKSRVQSEKEQAAQAKPPTEASTEPAAADAGGHPLPPADFQTIVSLLATQAMMSLGALPNPITGNAAVHPQQAKHFIDLLAVLEEKTRGNLSMAEQQELEKLLHELRMVFVAVQQQPPPPASPAAS
ncbi:MAG: DUF1844 domain-containing protein [Planctomycetales bacterium]|nr:DUF1844 domain-containing protein [Planctomycetales bacterium]NIM09413.1 DUF1844 domain-containing protein [Planctomycetales bacterium]NIN08891.1 DUF1844 domain-containing protein [Planctomycetales bacterium]NIN78006.1 DUF1844 domain-containing protein [Planctomycetales bacterium]NIO35194.1 DUF1844 domain-containing protein [Planctomycetales bacterium]